MQIVLRGIEESDKLFQKQLHMSIKSQGLDSFFYISSRSEIRRNAQ